MRENIEVLDKVARAGAHSYRMKGNEGNSRCVWKRILGRGTRKCRGPKARST